MECDNAGMDDAQRACLARLQEMDAALARMERELPDDVRSFGAEARRKVAAWRERLERDDLELSQLSEGLREISRMMDALTARLLLAPWDGPPRTGSKS
jgi:chromosome segregation ATPase